jgi:hypothetical protein
VEDHINIQIAGQRSQDELMPVGIDIARCVSSERRTIPYCKILQLAKVIA